jgi:pimeloyl-ACP methyl ester carboxylesterase
MSQPDDALPNIVLVHGARADGSSWSAVTERLQADGYTVTAPQFPMTALADDVARLRQVLTRQHGPTVVAGHSYGQIITALGTDAPNVVGLVYIAGFGLDEGESIGALLGQGPPTPALAHLDIDQHSFAWLPEDDFVNHFAADVDPWKLTYKWARHLHPNKPTRWVVRRYFGMFNRSRRDRWVSVTATAAPTCTGSPGPGSSDTRWSPARRPRTTPP